MSDIVEKLAKVEKLRYWPEEGLWVTAADVDLWDVCTEAADEIERLEAEIAMLRESATQEAISDDKVQELQGFLETNYGLGVRDHDAEDIVALLTDTEWQDDE